MLKAIQQFFDRRLSPGDLEAGDGEQRLRLATAALFIEVTRADFQVTEAEEESVEKAVQDTLGLTFDQARELTKLARLEADRSVELFEFTRLVDRGFSVAQKTEVVEMLWQIALADTRIDRHEEHIVRKIADLLHVPHREFVAAKKRARLSAGS